MLKMWKVVFKRPSKFCEESKSTRWSYWPL
nr:MAG TPA: hypothetical protein [Caudoviricetes sp.]